MVTADTPVYTSDILLRRSMLVAYDGRCFYSGRMVDIDNMAIDHILPVSLGGKNCISNYVLCDVSLNLKKSNTYNSEFGKIVKAYNDLVFVPKVIRAYNELGLNQELSEFVEIHKFLDSKCYFGDRQPIVYKAKRDLLFVKRTPDGQVRCKFYFEKEALDAWFKNAHGFRVRPFQASCLRGNGS